MLIWISSISASIITHFYFPLESYWLETNKKIHNPFFKVIITKIVTCCIMTLFMSFVIIIIQVICGNMTMEKGYAAFYFFLFFFSLAGLTVNNALIHLMPFICYYMFALIFMMLQVTTCGGILDHSLQKGFWKIGRALPMYYGVRQLKNIYWGVGEHTTVVNILVILAWIVVFSIITLLLYKMELRTKKEKWLRSQNRMLFHSEEGLNTSSNDLNTHTINLDEVPMDSMEDFNFPDEDTGNTNVNTSRRTLE